MKKLILLSLCAAIACGFASAKDTPDVPYRGVVEGFYGTPWSHEARVSMMEFLNKHRMNTYIYGPKDDAYHRSKWAEAYPEVEGQQIAQLARVADSLGVNFYWAIHPGADIVWDGTERPRIVEKFNRMYDLGVRSFAVFFDDIEGEGTKPEPQVELLNYIQREFLDVKPDVSPLIVCPTQYTQASNEKKPGYLEVMKERLDPRIAIMWTGRTVLSEIDRESMEWVNDRIGRKAFIWWNFPVSDYCLDKMLIGPAYGLDPEAAPLYSGFVSNPMEYAEASKIAIASVGDYLWDAKSYDPNKSWIEAMKELCPDNYESLNVFAMYNKSPLPNWESFAREEGTELKPIAEAALAGDPTALAALKKKCDELRLACELLLGDTSNPALIEELRPWLEQGINIGVYGAQLCDLAANPSQRTPDQIKLLDARRKHITDFERTGRQRETQNGIKLGTVVLMPTLDALHKSL